MRCYCPDPRVVLVDICFRRWASGVPSLWSGKHARRVGHARSVRDTRHCFHAPTRICRLCVQPLGWEDREALVGRQQCVSSNRFQSQITKCYSSSASLFSWHQQGSRHRPQRFSVLVPALRGSRSFQAQARAWPLESCPLDLDPRHRRGDNESDCTCGG